MIKNILSKLLFLVALILSIAVAICCIPLILVCAVIGGCVVAAEWLEGRHLW